MRPWVISHCNTGDIVSCHVIYHAVVWRIFVVVVGGYGSEDLTQICTNQESHSFQCAVAEVFPALPSLNLNSSRAPLCPAAIKHRAINDHCCQPQYVDICVSICVPANPALSKCPQACDMQMTGNLSSSATRLLKSGECGRGPYPLSPWNPH